MAYEQKGNFKTISFFHFIIKFSLGAAFFLSGIFSLFTSESIIVQSHFKQMGSGGDQFQSLLISMSLAKQGFIHFSDDNDTNIWIIRLLCFIAIYIGTFLMLKSISQLRFHSTICNNIRMVGVSFSANTISLIVYLTIISFLWIIQKPWVSAIGVLVCAFDGYLYNKRKNDKIFQYKVSIKEELINQTKRYKVKKYISDEGIEANTTRFTIQEINNELSPKSEKKWFIYGDGKKYGPFKIDVLKRYLDENKIKGSTLCREVSEGKKVKIKELDDLADYFEKKENK